MNQLEESTKVMSKKNFLIYTGKRGGTNHLMPIVSEMKKMKNLEFKIIFSDMHMDKKFGLTKNEFNKFKKNSFYLNSLYKKDNHLYRAKSIAKGLNNNVNIIEKFKPDFVIILGDRSELFSISIPSIIYNIPIIHIYGGDVTQGCTDEITRHSISMMSNFHFVSNFKSKKNLIKFGIDKSNIFNIGLISLSKIKKSRISSNKLLKKLGLDINKKLIISILHPETWDFKNHKKNVDIYFKSIEKIKENLILIYPCSDPGFDYIIDKIRELSAKYKNIKVFKNIEGSFFYEIMQHANLLIGNSSSGILESGYLNLPTINVGNRQKGRFCEKNVFHLKYNFKSLNKGIKKALSKNNEKKFNTSFLYYNKGGLNKILKFIKNVNKKTYKQILNLHS